MSKDVQLKESEIVGNEVVLSDIFPKTETPAVYDPSSGGQLAEVLSDMWNSINNKLSRIVNSVNNKTGVVVLDANDVGLGNVDNISFADIKKWVIQKIREEFDYKKLKLYDSKNDLDNAIASNDLNLNDSPFFVNRWTNVDVRSYIGYIYLLEDTLTYAYVPINTIGAHDETINYDKGNLSVNISSYEDALKVYNTFATPEENGLYIDKTKIAGTIHFYDCIYGNDGSGTGPTALLRLNNDSDLTYPRVKIYINNVDIIPTAEPVTRLNILTLHQNDIIICNMGFPTKKYHPLTSKPDDWDTYYYNYYIRRNGVYEPMAEQDETPTFVTGEYYKQSQISYDPTRYNMDLINYNTAIGFIESYPDNPTTSNPVVIKLYTFESKAGEGLNMVKPGKYIGGAVPNDAMENRPGRLNINQFHGHSVLYRSAPLDMSGLTTIKSLDDFSSNLKNSNFALNYNINESTIVTPDGVTSCIENGQLGNFKPGIRINTDLSLSLEANYEYSQVDSDKHASGSHAVCNWFVPSPTDTKNNISYLGINLAKATKYRIDPETSKPETVGVKQFTNISGLRVLTRHELEYDRSFVNLDEEDTASGWPVIECYYDPSTQKIYEDSEYTVEITPKKFVKYCNLNHTEQAPYIIIGPAYFYYDGSALEEYNEEYEIDDEQTLSGGLMVNTGRFLCIEPGITFDVGAPTSSKNQYYDGGKVSVRIDDETITDNGHNRLSVKRDPDGGVGITNGGLYIALTGCLGHSSESSTRGCIMLKLDPDSALEIDSSNQLTINIDKLKEQLGLS